MQIIVRVIMQRGPGPTFGPPQPWDDIEFFKVVGGVGGGVGSTCGGVRVAKQIVEWQRHGYVVVQRVGQVNC